MTGVCETSRDQLVRMVEAASLAPSAENTQPWRFAIDSDRLLVGIDRSRTLASDVDDMLTLTGIGAAIENAVIAARGQSLKPAVVYRGGAYEVGSESLGPPEGVNDEFNAIAKITTTPSETHDPLYPFLTKRCTTRRLTADPISPQVLQRLTYAAADFPGVRIDWLTTPKEIRPLAKLVGLCNRMRFEHEPFHREFYDNVRFSAADAERTRDGLDVRTLQLPIGVASLLKSLRYWKRMRAANWFGFSRAVARQAAEEVCSSGAVGILTVDRPTQESFLLGGRALERIWLATFREDLGFHPTASLPVLFAHVSRSKTSSLPANLQRVLTWRLLHSRTLSDLVGTRSLQMVFRLGKVSREPDRSLRRFHK